MFPRSHLTLPNTAGLLFLTDHKDDILSQCLDQNFIMFDLIAYRALLISNMYGIG